MNTRSRNANVLSGRLNVARECLLWLLRRRRRFKVVNDSMQPTARDGDYLVVDTHAYQSGQPQVGDVVLAYHPQQRDLVITKRVASVNSKNILELASDNPSVGQDSRQFGPIPTSQVLGRVTAVVR